MHGDSLRSAFSTEAGRQELPSGETLALTGHQTVATFSYSQAEASPTSKVASMLDEKEFGNADES